MSLRKRLVLTMMGLLVLALGASVGAIFGALQDWSGDANDDVLATVGREVRADLLAGRQLARDAPGPWRAAAEKGEIPSFFQVRGADGQVLRTVSFGAVPELPDPLTPALWPRELTAENPDGEWFADVDGNWLVRTSRLAERGAIVVVAMRTEKADELISRVTNVAIITSAVAIVALALLSPRVVRRSLRPLDDISETAAAIGSGDLTRRIDGADARTEVGRLGTALNAMLGQIESAFRERESSETRLRRFIADASHELRTPVATIRGYAELFRRGAAARPDDLAMAMRRIESEAERMGVLVDEMLLLARLDQGRPLEREPVPLAALATDAVADANAASPDHRFELEATPVSVAGDADRLRQVLGNLLANVIQHTPPGTSAVVRVRPEDHDAVVEVADNGPGVAVDDLPHVFERFYRGDSERLRDHGGAGLGLSIVSSVAAAHGGSATVRSNGESGTTFVVRLPLGDVRADLHG
ncbi:sensor histidine kinase [Actinokineospora sp.]|uniref:sensor histidine kinase n=1 Tax=Actinokineospora sp. TaxID=1872133 RepID=UPI003D6BAC68